MVFVVLDFYIFELKVIYIFYFRIQVEFRKRKGASLQLGLALFHMVLVDMGIAASKEEVAGFVAAHLCQHASQ